MKLRILVLVMVCVCVVLVKVNVFVLIVVVFSVVVKKVLCFLCCFMWVLRVLIRCMFLVMLGFFFCCCLWNGWLLVFLIVMFL